MRDAFSFSVVCMPHLDNNIPSNIYNASMGSEILKFPVTTSDINTFVTLSLRFIKRIQKQRSKHRSILSMLNKIFGKPTLFNVFGDTDTAANFIKLFLLPWIKTIHVHVCLLHSLFVLFIFICLFLCLCYYLIKINFVSSSYVSMYFQLFIFYCVSVFYYDFTITQHFCLEKPISLNIV